MIIAADHPQQYLLFEKNSQYSSRTKASCGQPVMDYSVSLLITASGKEYVIMPLFAEG